MADECRGVPADGDEDALACLAFGDKKAVAGDTAGEGFEDLSAFDFVEGEDVGRAGAVGVGRCEERDDALDPRKLVVEVLDVPWSK